MKPRTTLLIIIMLFSAVIVNAQNKTILWQEDFESDWYENWYVDIGTWEVGTPTSGPQSAHTGNNCAATVLNGNYPNSVKTRLIRYTSFVVPPASENPALRFWHWFSTDSHDDWGEVQIKTENGEWESVSLRYYYEGSGVWTHPYIDLSDYSDSTIQIAFYFLSNSYDASSGWYIDDVELITGPQLFNNPEGFESGLGNWSVDRGTWEVGIPTEGPGNAYGGQYCAGTKLEGLYSNNVASRLVSPPFMVPARTENPALRFWHWFSTDSHDDWGEVQVKTENGEWESVSLRYYYEGSGVWTHPYIDLSDYSDSTIQIAFYFLSNSYDASSGWYIDDVELITGPRLFNNPEGFESGLGNWSVDRGTWEVGIPKEGPSNAHGGQYCAGTKLEGLYSNNVASRLVSPPFMVPAETANPAIRFWHWFNISGSDAGEIQITTDDGITWETLSTQPITSSSGSWSHYYLSISSFAEQKVRLAFYFISNPYDASSGWYIDDVSITDNSDMTVYAGPDITLDPCGSAAISATVSGGTEPYLIEWIPAAGLDDPTSLNPVASSSDTTVYTLRVTDANGCFRTDRIVVNANCEVSNTETEILSYSFGKPPQTGSSVINPDAHTIEVEVKYGTDLTNLVATFTLSEDATASVNGVDQLSGYTVNDFSSPVTYLITAEDGVTVQEWIVNVSLSAGDAADILSYSFGKPPQTGDAMIDPAAHTVYIKIENGTDLTNLVASFTLSDGATASVGEVQQQSGVTANDFTEPVTYAITAINGITVQDWVVSVVEAALNETDILSYSFGIPPQTGEAVINPMNHSVDIEVENGTDLTNLAASFTLSDGATASVGGVEQQSGITVNDFTSPVTYSITAADETTLQDWTISIDLAVGMVDHTTGNMSIFPNPFSDKTTIQLFNPDHSDLTLSVFNVLGEKVFESGTITSDKIAFNQGKLPSGVYYVVLKGKNLVENRKIIIE